ncbi:MAG TPA: hypothetical protein PKE47_06530, partial [Verrucomicrobiota bacterium]|nr:hypothetical protein [Verrucomicrobiota bacterium]
MLRAALLAALVFLLPACSSAPSRDAAAAESGAGRPVPGLPPVPGRVHSVNPGLKFAIIDYS